MGLQQIIAETEDYDSTIASPSLFLDVFDEAKPLDSEANFITWNGAVISSLELHHGLELVG